MGCFYNIFLTLDERVRLEQICIVFCFQGKLICK